MVEVNSPPMTTVASGRWISAPGVVARAMGMKPRPATRAVMRIGRSRTMAASRAASWGSMSILPQVLDGADPDQAVEHGHAEEGDEPDRRRDREGQAAEDQGEHAAGRGHGDRQVDQKRQPHRVERAVEQEENQQHGHGNDDRQPPRGRLQVLELAAPVEDVTWRAGDLGLDRRLGFGHEPGNITVSNVHAHVNPALDVLALDLAGPLLHGNVGQVFQRDRAALIINDPDRADPCRHRPRQEAGRRTWSRCLICPSNTVPTVVPPRAATASSTSEALIP